ncbi:putative protein N(5)-glutamine methyltransferase [Nocardioides nanhaiensis]|uniref:peptide chain release factor N(5)-glutamine methyltransferase n=1 Tax=Nocardioides nanhaiensis TaxID=1476871 RepID=A0ABP8W9K0_9ACTN
MGEVGGPGREQERTVAVLRAAGCVFAEEEAAALHAHEADGAARAALVRRRAAGEPLEHLLGWAELDGERVLVDAGVFVPRQRSRLLVRAAVAELRHAGHPRNAPVVVDLCCGSGALGALVQRRVPHAEVHAADLDPAAVACARRNLTPTRVHEGDLLAALPGGLRGRVRVLVVNAPYVPTTAIATMPPEARDHEPRLALDGGADGIAVQRRLAGDVAAWLAPDGVLLLETGRHQRAATTALLQAAGLAVDQLEDPEVDGFAVRAHAAPGRP